MASTSDIRNGLCIKYNHDIYKIIEFLHVKPDVWVPKKGRLIHTAYKNNPTVQMEVLKVIVNDDLDPALFKNFPWDDPKYNTKFGMKWEGEHLRRTNRILFKDHPTYFDKFFGITLDEAYQLFLKIE